MKTVIGLEIHAELLTKSKAFCSCENSFGKDKNENTCPVCLGLPGALPVLSKGAVITAAKAALALNCTVNNYMRFDRKNYFYPDLPKSYQITQQFYPLSSGGVIEINDKKFRINNIHLEEDAGKIIHTCDASVLDFNRAGVPLIEIVTEPDFSSTDEVIKFVSCVARRLKYADVCDAKMEEGSLRVDVNISVTDTDIPGTRTELKNLSSLRSIKRAIEYEAKRQEEVILSGGSVICETRRFDEATGKTYSMRKKEDISDYRYFAEPDMPPVIITDNDIQNIKDSISELPEKRYKKYTTEFGLNEDTADLILEEKVFSDFYDSSVKIYPAYREIANLMTGEVLRIVSGAHKKICETKLTPESLAEIAKMSQNGEINKNSAKKILTHSAVTGDDPLSFAEKNNLLIKNDTAYLNECIEKVLSKNTKLVSDYKNGNTKLFGFLMGEAMRESDRSANPSIIKELLINKLEDE